MLNSANNQNGEISIKACDIADLPAEKDWASPPLRRGQTPPRTPRPRRAWSPRRRQSSSSGCRTVVGFGRTEICFLCNKFEYIC